MNNFFYYKSIFFNDIFCMLVIIILITRNKSSIQKKLVDYKKQSEDFSKNKQSSWNKNSLIIVLTLVLVTTSLALIQVTLPLDLVKGGIFRKALDENLISFLISLQLILLLFLQWPIGAWISKKGRLFGLKLTLINFAFASLLLFITSYLHNSAIYLILISIILISLGTSSFLPTSTDVVFNLAPSNKKGYALALLSQCFAMGYFFGPFISGRVLDIFGYASVIWLSISIGCFLMCSAIYRKSF